MDATRIAMLHRHWVTRATTVKPVVFPHLIQQTCLILRIFATAHGGRDEVAWELTEDIRKWPRQALAGSVDTRFQEDDGCPSAREAEQASRAVALGPGSHSRHAPECLPSATAVGASVITEEQKGNPAHAAGVTAHTLPSM
eukprot:6212752-Pleurochrysis_carterae.AAC.2